MTEWISVKDRLPPISFREDDNPSMPYEPHCVLLYIPPPEGRDKDHALIIVGIYEEEVLEPYPSIGRWFNLNNDCQELFYHPTHWMPLPEPPIKPEIVGEWGCSSPISCMTSEGMKRMVPGKRYDDNWDEIKEEPPLTNPIPYIE
jgi:hypothetical protein